MKRIISFAMAMLMVATLCACGGSNDAPAPAPAPSTSSSAPAPAPAPAPEVKPVKLNLSVPDPETSSIGIAAAEYAKQLNEKSEGRLDVKVFYNGELYGGDATAAVTTMQDGGLDMLCLASSWYSSFDSAFNVINTPFLFRSIDSARAYLNDPVSQPMWDAVENLGVKFLAPWTRSFRMTTNSVRPITQPSDFEGIKLRTPGNQMYIAFFEACGAAATPMSFSEVYSALQTKTIDGQENPPDVPHSSSFYEVQKYISATNHIAEAWIVGMNPEKFDSLDADLQTLIVETAQEMQQWKLDYDNATDQSCVDFMVEKGMEYNELDDAGFAAFQEVAASLYPEFQKIVNNDDLWNSTLEFASTH